MEILPLVSNRNDDADHVFTAKIRVAVSADEFGRACRVRSGLLRERRLTSIHEHREELVLHETILGPSRITADNPFLPDIQRSKLDGLGVIRQGLMVEPGDVLVSVLHSPRHMPPEEAPAKGMEWVGDESVRAPHGWDGATVLKTEHRTRRELGKQCPRGAQSVTTVVLHAERDLEVGDVLMFGELPLVVAGSLPDHAMPLDSEGRRADIVIGLSVAQDLGLSPRRVHVLEMSKGRSRAADVFQARGMGAYSLITLQPLGKESQAPQRVHPQHAGWLWQHGLHAILGELASLKSDDLAGRASISRQLGAGQRLDDIDVPSPGAPESLAMVVTGLQTLGLNVALNRLNHAVGICVQAATTTELLALSHGHVRKPETIHYDTYADFEEGLFCPRIFGDSQQMRRRRFGHVPLPAPIVPIVWRTGKPSVLESCLQLAASEIERIVNWADDVYWREGQIRLVERGPEAAPHDIGPEWESLGSGGAAIRALLSRIDQDRLPPGLRQRATAFTLDAILVPPPDLRPLVLLDSGNFATSDLNELLRQVVNRRNRLVKLIELNAPQAVLDNEHRELQATIDAFHGNCLLAERDAAVDDQGRRLRCTLDMLLGHVAEDWPKKVDWSARARVVVNASLPRQQAIVPRPLFAALQLDIRSPILVTCETGDGRMIAVLPDSADENVIQLSPASYAALELSTESIADCIIHRPLSLAAKAEARELLQHGPGQSKPPSSPQGFLAAGTAQELARSLASSAASPSVVALDSLRHLLVGGCGAIEIPPDPYNVPKSTRANLRQVPIAASAEEIPKAPPTREQVLTAINEYRRKVCIFAAEPTDHEPPASAGRLGGRPYLPAGISWPISRGKPMQFIGQLPLEPARAAALLPVEVPRDSLLTIFWDGEWKPRLSASGGPVFIHPIAGCVLAQPPDDKDLQIGTCCSLRMEMSEEVPPIKTLLSLLDWDLDKPDAEELRKLVVPELLTVPEAKEAIKLGGWPHWIQHGVEDARLLAQIASNDDADIMFGDAGSMYILVRDNGQLEIVVECY